MIRRCIDSDLPAIEAIINEAAQVYRNSIPADCWHEPYMPTEELNAEIAAGVSFWAWDETTRLLGVMGIQKVREVTLIRHAYVSTAYQGRGIGSELLKALVAQDSPLLLVGTWAAADWAIRFYQRHGFHLITGPEKDRLLDVYWCIPRRQRDTSVVLIHGCPETTRLARINFPRPNQSS